MSTLNSRLRGLAATLALVAFVVGVPAVLLAIDAVPDLAAFSWSRLTAPDDGTLVVEVIAAVCWIAWAVFTCQLVASIVSQIRGIRTPRLPGLAMPQLAADRLVAAAALLFVAVPSATAFLPQPRAEAAVTAAPLPDAHSSHGRARSRRCTGAGGRATKKEPEVERYTVKRGDSLWKIAEERLGDGTRYVELVELNEAVLDGRPDFLLPGTVLRVPVAEDRAGGRLRRPARRHPLRDRRGRTRRRRRLPLDLRGVPRHRSGRTAPTSPIPDLILPGWKLTIPGQQTRASRTKPKHAQEPTRPDDDSPRRCHTSEPPKWPIRRRSRPTTKLPRTRSSQLAAPRTRRCGSAPRRRRSGWCCGSTGEPNCAIAVPARSSRPRRRNSSRPRSRSRPRRP